MVILENWTKSPRANDDAGELRESGLGFSIRATTVRGVSFVREDIPVRAEAPELGAVVPVAMVLDAALPAPL